jgi:hypothetical protein
VVEKLAEPLVSAPVPISTPPSWNETVPLAVAGETVAFNVMLSPRLAGLSVDERVVVVPCKIVREKVALTTRGVGEVESVTVIRILEVVPVETGVPLIMPVVLLILRPVGNPVADQE